MKHKLLLLFICLCVNFLPIKASVNLNIGETYSCTLGYISNFKECVWTTSDYKCLDFVGNVTNHSTEVTVKVLAKPSYATPVTIHCQYYYYDLDPTTGRYTYLRSSYKDFYFFIKDDGAEGVSVYPSNLELNPGDTYNLRAQVSPSSADQTVEWSTSDNTIALVNSNGQVTAKSVGEAIITATASNGKKGQCYVAVKASYISVIDVVLDIYSLTMNIGDTRQLTATVYPADATEKSVIWSSYDNDIVSITNSGIVKAIGKGETLISCKTKDGGFEAFCSITVNGTVSGLQKWNVEQIATSQSHTMILLSNGSLYACGSNFYGQLGDGTTANKATPIKIMEGVASVSAGSNHTMILKADGTLWACGGNYYGQLCDGTTAGKTTPVKIMEGVASVSAGSFHSMILKTDGSLWACGYNFYGQLGDGTTTNKTTPVKIMEGVASVSTGLTGHSTMILKIDGSLWACGWNSVGELGDGTTANKATPVKIMEGVASVSVGASYTMILKTDGSLWACGYNNHNQLCDGTTAKRVTPIEVMDGVATVSCGNSHTMVIKTDGTLWACGSNYYGQLCDGTTTDKATPMKVMDNVADVFAGSVYSMVLKTDGTLWACGSNDYGQLCDGTTMNKSVPIQISEPEPSSSIRNTFIREDGKTIIYNLSGQNLAAPKKGLNIINGKKILVK